MKFFLSVLMFFLMGGRPEPETDRRTDAERDHEWRHGR